MIQDPNLSRIEALQNSQQTGKAGTKDLMPTDHSPSTLSSTPTSNGFKTVTPLQVNPFCRSSESKKRHAPAADAERMIESQMPKLCPAARSIAAARTALEVSIELKVSCQLRIASRARAGVRSALRTKTA